MLHWAFLLVVSVQLVHLVIVTADNGTYTPPDVNLTSCLGEIVRFSITNMVAGGLIYLRTIRGVYKVEPSFNTNGQEYIYQCNFADCGIEWYEKFTFISQRHVVIQTVHDLHKTFICLADLISIMPGGGNPYESNSTDLVRYLYRASASMTFFDTDGTELVSGSFVKLGTQVDIYINLTNNIGDMFDLTVKSCDVILLPIISGRCPLDGELFDQFTKLSVGYLYNNFSMFRPTSTASGAMDVLFSCTLEICRNPCPTYICNGTEAILVNDTESDEASRRKRQAASSTTSRSLKLGTIFKVDYEEPEPVMPADNCMSTNTLLAVFTSLGMILLAMIVFMIHFTMEWKRQPKPVSKVQTTASPYTAIQTVSSAVSGSTPVKADDKDSPGNSNINITNNISIKSGGVDNVHGVNIHQKTENHKDTHKDVITNKKQDEMLNDCKKKLLAKMISSPELLHSLSKQTKSAGNTAIQKEHSDDHVGNANERTKIEAGPLRPYPGQIDTILTRNTSSVQTCTKSVLKQQDREQRIRSASDAIPRQTPPIQKRPASTSSMQPLNGVEIAMHHRIASGIVAKEFETKRARTTSTASNGSTKYDNISDVMNSNAKKPFLKQISSISLPLKPCLGYNPSQTSVDSSRTIDHLRREAMKREILNKNRSLSEAVTESIKKECQDYIIPQAAMEKEKGCQKQTEDKRSRSSSSFL